MSKKFSPSTFFTSRVKVNKNSVSIELPKGILKHVDFSGNNVFCTIIDGVLQVSGSQPQVSIPVLSSNSIQNFMGHPQTENDTAY